MPNLRATGGASLERRGNAWELGFENLLGIDPHLDQSVTYRNGLRIERRELESPEGEWVIRDFRGATSET
ncbi:MAG: hypothetical protein KAJ42_09050, partial [Gemmatimonadetes bacterium]|nr:hypothetical protein [Gemmatimonadota bacterium]